MTASKVRLRPSPVPVPMSPIEYGTSHAGEAVALQLARADPEHERTVPVLFRFDASSLVVS